MIKRIDIKDEDRLELVEYGKLLRILMLMEANSHLSASRAGLEERHKNRDEAIRLLQQIMEITDKELEEMYQLFLMEDA